MLSKASVAALPVLRGAGRAAARAVSGSAAANGHKHFRMTKDETEDQFMNHPTYSQEELDAVKVSQRAPETTLDTVAFYAMKAMRTGFDTATGCGCRWCAARKFRRQARFRKRRRYGKDMDEHKWLTRMIFLETVAGVPGMVGGMWRHFKALRSMGRDYGWIHTLLEEAENERMHLMTFLELRKPGGIFRAAVLATQGVFFNVYFLAYILAPQTCHRFVGYLEEEAVVTYSKAIAQLEAGELRQWEHMPASPLARKYWRLPADAMFLDVLKAIRADEMVHREVNHTLASVDYGAPNPFAPHYMQQRDVSKDVGQTA